MQAVALVAAEMETCRASFCSGSPICFVTPDVTSYQQKASPFLIFDKTASRVFPGSRLHGGAVLAKDKPPPRSALAMFSVAAGQGPWAHTSGLRMLLSSSPFFLI